MPIEHTIAIPFIPGHKRSVVVAHRKSSVDIEGEDIHKPNRSQTTIDGKATAQTLQAIQLDYKPLGKLQIGVTQIRLGLRGMAPHKHVPQ